MLQAIKVHFTLTMVGLAIKECKFILCGRDLHYLAYVATCRTRSSQTQASCNGYGGIGTLVISSPDEGPSKLK